MKNTKNPAINNLSIAIIYFFLLIFLNISNNIGRRNQVFT